MTYKELAAECEKQGFSLMPKFTKHTFSVNVSFDRGLGAEYISLRPVTADTIQDAYNMAWEEATHYFASEKIEKINEVRINPYEIKN